MMSMYNLIEYSKNYARISRDLWQYYRDDPNDDITVSDKIDRTSAAGNTKDVETTVPLPYLTNFWKTLEMPLNCGVKFMLASQETGQQTALLTNQHKQEHLQ